MKHFDAMIQGDKPVVVCFSAEWNETGMLMKSVMEQTREIAGPGLVIIHIDIDQHPHYSQVYQVVSIPTIAIFRNGRELWRKTGFVRPEEILHHLPAGVK